ncbi:hypothetical protein EJ08DRAFT_691127 [Tothia fuscella]|uniref:J domain-containing protein n=1 Tax=Tothia fuscella TaxID=1048955 RepID=A0A9P4P214_9PEZI|nr:hypothetical protein EJ08DRAFT_691127 [Tothia fuscella]
MNFLNSRKTNQHYTVLDLSPGADRSQVRARHRELVAKYHPDKTFHEPQHIKDEYAAKFLEVQDAYENLIKIVESEIQPTMKSTPTTRPPSTPTTKPEPAARPPIRPYHFAGTCTVRVTTNGETIFQGSPVFHDKYPPTFRTPVSFIGNPSFQCQTRFLSTSRFTSGIPLFAAKITTFSQPVSFGGVTSALGCSPRFKGRLTWFHSTARFAGDVTKTVTFDGNVVFADEVIFGIGKVIFRGEVTFSKSVTLNANVEFVKNPIFEDNATFQGDVIFCRSAQFNRRYARTVVFNKRVHFGGEKPTPKSAPKTRFCYHEPGDGLEWLREWARKV